MPSRTYDNLLLLKDAGAIAADLPATVGGSARVLDVGNAHMDGIAVVDTSAIDFADANETYTVRIQGSTAIGFGTFVELAAREIKTVGRIEILFNNEIGGTYYQYIRAFNDTGGVTPSINSTIFIAIQ